MEKIIKIDSKDLDFKTDQIKEVKRVDIHSDYLEILVVLKK